MLKLYDYFRSSACYRVRIALNLKNLTYETISIHLLKQGGEQFSENYSKINPQNLVPALLHEDKIITQSLSIIEYLDTVFPEPSLLPQDPYKKAMVKSFALSIASDIHPLNNLRVLKYLENQLLISEEQKNAWYRHWIDKGLFALEEQVKKFNDQANFCFGDEPSLADVCLIPQLYNAKRFQCSLNTYPILLRIEKNCQNHPAFLAASPETSPEYTP